MVGDTVIDPLTGRALVIVHDFAHNGKDDDLLFRPDDHDPTEASQHVKTQSRPRLPGSGKRTRAKVIKE